MRRHRVVRLRFRSLAIDYESKPRQRIASVCPSCDPNRIELCGDCQECLEEELWILGQDHTPGDE